MQINMFCIKTSDTASIKLKQKCVLHIVKRKQYQNGGKENILPAHLYLLVNSLIIVRQH